MKHVLALFIFFYSCNSASDNSTQQKPDSENPETENSIPAIKVSDNSTVSYKDSTYANKAFRNVVVTETGNGYFEINGEARVFEGTFYYFLRQEKKESDDEFVTASLGTPDWGKFNFSVNTSIFKNDIPLYLVMFQSSPKDGSRIDELTIRLF